MKKILSLMLCLFLLLSLVGCEGYVITGKTVEVDGVVYAPFPGGESYTVIGISDAGREKKVLYVQEEIDGSPVNFIGLNSPVSGYRANIGSKKTEKIYMTWRTRDVGGTISVSEDTYYFYINVEEPPPFGFYTKAHCVVPSIVYKELGGELICANIAYFFNYEGNPNEGYFFIDLLEETGKLTPPPYSPKREGYVFDGWYKDEACTEIWSFDTDTVTVEKDVDGNIVYEEVKLYAKWKEK